MDLHTETHDGINITVSGTVLTFVYGGTTNKSVYCRRGVGSPEKPIVGGTIYAVLVYINGIRLSSDSNVQVAQVPQTMLHSREFLLKPGDTLQVKVKGAGPDTDTYTNAILIDNTPITADNVYGNGSVVVDHNYGGPDSLTVTDPSGAGIQDADIVSYLQSDYDGGQRGNGYIRGRTTTNVSGHWRNPMMLEPDLYVLLVSKPRSYSPEVTPLAVLEEVP